MIDPRNEVYTSAVFGNPAELTYPKAWTGSLHLSLSLFPHFFVHESTPCAWLGEGAGLKGMSFSYRQVGGRAVRSYL